MNQRRTFWRRSVDPSNGISFHWFPSPLGNGKEEEVSFMSPPPPRQTSAHEDGTSQAQGQNRQSIRCAKPSRWASPLRASRRGAFASAAPPVAAARTVVRAGAVGAVLSSAACVFSSSPAARVNQLGYLPSSTKVAVIQTDAARSLPFSVQTSDGRVALQGNTQVRKGTDEESGHSVHWADFSALAVEGTDYALHVDGSSSYGFDISNGIYGELRRAALNYFYHNRSGTPIEIPWAGAWKWTRPPGHLSDESVGCLTPCNYTLNVLGGWYDAGDYGKYVVNGGISVWTLLNLYERALHRKPDSLPALGDGSLALPEENNGIPDILDEARWEVEFLLRMQVPQGQPLSGMAHHKIHDTSWSPLGSPPAEHWEERYLHPPSTAATLNLAAVAAQAMRIWKQLDPAFAEACRLAAIRAWNAAHAHPAVYAPQYDNMGGGPYDDGELSDEFYWAGAELYLSLGTDNLYSFLETSPHHLEFSAQTGHEHVQHHTAMTWQSTAALGALSLLTVPGDLPPGAAAELEAAVLRAADHYVELSEAQGYRVPLRAGSNGHYPWGSNSLVVNNALVMAVAFDLSGQQRYLDGVVDGMDYILGRNPLNLSYVSGFGDNAFENPHHRFWAHQKNSRFPHPPPGALAGGPNSRRQDPTMNRTAKRPPQQSYIDHVDAWSVNEVAINWNAPLAWVASFLEERGRTPSHGPRDPKRSPRASSPKGAQ